MNSTIFLYHFHIDLVFGFFPLIPGGNRRGLLRKTAEQRCIFMHPPAFSVAKGAVSGGFAVFFSFIRESFEKKQNRAC